MPNALTITRNGRSPGTAAARTRRSRPAIRALLVAVAVGAITAAECGGAGRPLLVTVDDLPISAGDLHPDPADRERMTQALLAALARYEIPAVGLVTWGNVRGDSDRALLRLWLEAGHELGNHSMSHPDFSAVDPETYIADVEAGRLALAGFLGPLGRRVRFFRFPMLREGDSVEKLRAMRAYLRESGQRPLPVTLDNQDWSFERPWVEAVRARDEAAVREVGTRFQESLRLAVRHHEGTGDRLLGRVSPQILLLHATEVGAAQWDELFGWLRERGYRFAAVDEVLSDPAFADPPEYVGTHGPGYWDRVEAVRRETGAVAEIRSLFETQVGAWNRGDLEGFCSAYAGDTLFLTPAGPTRGRDEILARYRQRYPDAAAMGRLRLDLEEIRLTHGTEVSMMGDAVPGRIHGATVAARWTLSYPDRDGASGWTLIALRRGSGGWAIVQDASM